MIISRFFTILFSNIAFPVFVLLVITAMLKCKWVMLVQKYKKNKSGDREREKR